MENKFTKVGKVSEINGTILSPHHGGLKFVLSVARIDGKLENVMMDVFSKRWFKFRENLAAIYAGRTGSYVMGYVSDLAVQSDVWLQQMVCINEKGKLNIDGLRAALKKVKSSADYEHASVHVSRVLVSAYPKMEDIINEELAGNGINVTYYTEP